MHGLGGGTGGIEFEPDYKWNDKLMYNKEINEPPRALFYPVGWDRDDVIYKNKQLVLVFEFVAQDLK